MQIQNDKVTVGQWGRGRHEDECLSGIARKIIARQKKIDENKVSAKDIREAVKYLYNLNKSNRKVISRKTIYQGVVLKLGKYALPVTQNYPSAPAKVDRTPVDPGNPASRVAKIEYGPPPQQAVSVSSTQAVTLTAKDAKDAPVANAKIRIVVKGPDGGTGQAIIPEQPQETDPTGQIHFSVTVGDKAGDYIVSAVVIGEKNKVDRPEKYVIGARAASAGLTISAVAAGTAPAPGPQGNTDPPSIIPPPVPGPDDPKVTLPFTANVTPSFQSMKLFDNSVLPSFRVYHSDFTFPLLGSRESLQPYGVAYPIALAGKVKEAIGVGADISGLGSFEVLPFLKPLTIGFAEDTGALAAAWDTTTGKIALGFNPWFFLIGGVGKSIYNQAPVVESEAKLEEKKADWQKRFDAWTAKQPTASGAPPVDPEEGFSLAAEKGQINAATLQVELARHKAEPDGIRIGSYRLPVPGVEAAQLAMRVLKFLTFGWIHPPKSKAEKRAEVAAKLEETTLTCLKELAALWNPDAGGKVTLTTSMYEKIGFLGQMLAGTGLKDKVKVEIHKFFAAKLLPLPSKS